MHFRIRAIPAELQSGPLAARFCWILTSTRRFSPRRSRQAEAFFCHDGKYVLFWNIDTAADHATGPLIRYNADGSFDNSFSFSRDYAGAGPVGPTADGKLIVGASKIIYGVPEPFQHQINDILRLNGDGSIDPTFGPAQTTDGGEVRVLTINNDGTILIGGLFTEFNQTTPRHGIVRLLADGTVDPTFAPVTMTCPQFPFGSSGCGLWADPVVDGDGKIIIAGDFIADKRSPEERVWRA